MTDLIQTLVSKLGVKEDQARGGAGLILKLAQEKLGSDFAAVEQAVPEAGELVQEAPSAGGVAGLAGGILGGLGGGKLAGLAGMAGLAEGFSTLNPDGGMVGRFIPLILGVVKRSGGEKVESLLAGVLKQTP